MAAPHATGVWISADFASVVRWSGDVACATASSPRSPAGIA
jgi:hypothetical protein